MDALADLVPFAQLTATGALVLILLSLFRAISRGDWVPRREMDYVRSDRDARLAEKDAEIAYLRGAHETSERARELLNQTTRDTVAALRTQEHFFDALRAQAVGPPGKDAGDVR